MQLTVSILHVRIKITAIETIATNQATTSVPRVNVHSSYHSIIFTVFSMSVCRVSVIKCVQLLKYGELTLLDNI